MLSRYSEAPVSICLPNLPIGVLMARQVVSEIHRVMEEVCKCNVETYDGFF